MIVTLEDELFKPDVADDADLVELICNGQRRYKVQTRPAYRPQEKRPVNAWLSNHSLKLQEKIKIVLEEGLRAPEYAFQSGAREPHIVVERQGSPEWPDSFDQGPARLPLPLAKAFVLRPLRLLLENGRNDWSFLNKVVPPSWKARWDLAISKGWIEEHNGGGISEMRRIIEERLAMDHVRRLRTWAMFDSDGERAGDASKDSKDTRAACEDWSIAFHPLRRRAIENYIPRETLKDWVLRRHHKSTRDEMLARLRAYCKLPTDEQRHYFDMKKGFHEQIAQHVWSDAEKSGDGTHKVYAIAEAALLGDGFGPERDQLFQSLFSRF
jgi:hypothetical protein